MWDQFTRKSQDCRTDWEVVGGRILVREQWKHHFHIIVKETASTGKRTMCH